MKKLIYYFTRMFWKITRPIGKHIHPFEITISTKYNDQFETEHTFISFISKNQLPLVMIITEYIDNFTNQITYATCKSIL